MSEPTPEQIEAGHKAITVDLRMSLKDEELAAVYTAMRALDKPDTEWQEAEQLARRFHETYERLAPQFNYETRKASAVPWESVPENNRKLMIAVAHEIVAASPLDERVRGVIRDCRANFWVGRKEAQGQQEFLDRTWEKLKALDAAFGRSGP